MATTTTTTDDLRKQRDLATDDMTIAKDSPQHDYIANNGNATLTVTYTTYAFSALITFFLFVCLCSDAIKM